MIKVYEKFRVSGATNQHSKEEKSQSQHSYEQNNRAFLRDDASL